MIPKTSYRKKLFAYFLMVFIVFTSVITVVQYQREKDFRAKELETILDTYSDYVHSFITYNEIGADKDYSMLDSIKRILPRNDIRITVIALDGTVLYDSFYKNYSEMSNHIARPEVQGAIFANEGTNIRLSASTDQEFYYYAKKYNQFFVRTAVLYSLNIKEFLKIDTLFWYFIAVLFLITSSVLLYVSDTVGKSISKLKDFAVQAARNEKPIIPVDFPENELGEIGNQIVNIYNTLNETNKELHNEKEKLFHHIQISKEGIAIFSKTDETILANNFFFQYLNLISESNTTNASLILQIEELAPIRQFVESYSDKSSLSAEHTLPVKRLSFAKNMRYFEIQCIVFHDLSYEISISDVTQSVKQKKLKQEMTSNIAHELRTPVSSIKGYLETVLTGKAIEPEKQRYFIEKASLQTDRLADLIRDISVITKIEESAEQYQQEEIKLHSLINDAVENLQTLIDKTDAKIENNIKESTKIKGNRVLIFSVFQNLIENSLNYGGDDITITIGEYLTDKNKVHITFSDDGVGIEETHMSRIFERFYRIDKGRNRETGGTGLGLAIVKNAIEMHGGSIVVKNRKDGGAEFLFSLNKA